ncbi:MAG: VWA domain-containing protein [Vicinamibacterales bacterium]
MSSRLFAAVCLVGAAAVSVPGRAQDRPAEAKQEAQRPTFRSGAHYVRVDAYPTRDGKPIPGLTADDFELLEDGKPQAIETFEYIDHPTFTPVHERRDPNSQRDGMELARDPKYRVFVLYLDAYHVDFSGGHRVRVPLRELLNRMMGPQDLFGFLTPAQSPKDLLLGQLTLQIEDQLENMPYWGIADRIEPQPGELELEFAFPRDGKYLVALQRLDKVYSDLEGLVEMLDDLREERKNIIFFSDTIPSPGTRFANIASDPDPRSRRGGPPPIGPDPSGTLTIGDRNAGEPDRMRMEAERQRLLALDFGDRFRQLLRRSRQANVSFYTVRPGGLDMNSSLLNEGVSNLQVLADETDGIGVLASNDLRAGMGRIADDLSSHYVLGYYTNNTRWDGGTRRLTVRLKATRQTIRARREYRAPTEAEMAAIRDARTAAASAPSAPSEADIALSALKRLRPASRVQAYGAVNGPNVTIAAEISASEIEEGRWKQGAAVDVTLTSKQGQTQTATGRIEPGSRGTLVRLPVGADAGPWQATVRFKGDDPLPDSDSLGIARPEGAVLGAPLAYRAGSAAASPFRPIAAFHFRRTERIRIDWPVLQPLASHSARLLDRTGKPLPVPVTLAPRQVDGVTVLSGILNLAPFSIGDYLIEVNATAGLTTEQQLVAIRVAMAR